MHPVAVFLKDNLNKPQIELTSFKNKIKDLPISTLCKELELEGIQGTFKMNTKGLYYVPSRHI